MTTVFTVHPRGMGRRGHFAASVHGTEGSPMPYGAQIVSLWSAAFEWPEEQKPIYILKILGHGGTNPRGSQIRFESPRHVASAPVCRSEMTSPPVGRPMTLARFQPEYWIS